MTMEIRFPICAVLIDFGVIISFDVVFQVHSMELLPFRIGYMYMSCTGHVHVLDNTQYYKK